MKKPQILTAVLAVLVTCISGAEETAFPERLKTLTANYEAAIGRATAPLTKAYLDELNKMKFEYTRAGDLKSALLVETLITKYTTETAPTAPAKDQPLPHMLTRMTIDQFKSWLATVVIVQGDGGVIEYDGATIFVTDHRTSIRSPYRKATIEIGKITIPFSASIYTVNIDSRLKSATINTSTGAQFPAKIEPKKEK